MTPEEQLDDARATEVLHRLVNSGSVVSARDLAALGARLARENWIPPEPVDPDILAFREWSANRASWTRASAYRQGRFDHTDFAQAYLAGAHMARERERARAKPLAEYVKKRRYDDGEAYHILAKYKEKYDDPDERTDQDRSKTACNRALRVWGDGLPG